MYGVCKQMSVKSNQSNLNHNYLINRIAVFLLLFFIPLYVYSEDSEKEEAIENFNNLLSLKLTAIYNFMMFEQSSQKQSYYTNRPLDVGIELGIKNISAGFSTSVPFLYDRNYEKSRSYDFSFNRYAKISYSNAYFKYYSGFNDRSEYNFDLRIFNLGYSNIFTFNRDHSIRSAYILDQKQNVSNGSFLLGGGIFFTAIRSESDYLNEYSESVNAFYFGPIAGYSYTFVLPANFFINVLATAGINLVISGGEAFFGAQALPRVSLGYHGKKWSINAWGNFTYLLNSYNEILDYNLMTGNIGISFIRRFITIKPKLP